MLQPHSEQTKDEVGPIVSRVEGCDLSLQTVLDHLPHIAWTVAANGTPLFYNAKWFQYTGLDQARAVQLSEVIHPDDYLAAMQKRKAAYEAGEVYVAEFRLKRRDGQYRWHRTQSEPLLDSAGKIVRYLKTTIDIQAERDLESLNAELDRRVHERTIDLEEANTELEAFTYHVAHDLRAPLRAIVAKSRMLEEDFASFLPEEAVVLIRRQVQAANQLGTLIDELLKLSRLARQEVHCQSVSLSDIAADVAREIGADNPSVEIKIRDSIEVLADPRLLRLLLTNLLANALQYSPGGGVVEVGEEPTQHGRSFFVRDEGIGFDMKFAVKMFEPFERLVSDTEFVGTGVGLANVARIVAKHRGKVWAIGEPGKGSTFYFTLQEDIGVDGLHHTTVEP